MNKSITILFLALFAYIKVNAQTSSKDSLKITNFQKSTCLDSFIGKYNIKIYYRSGTNVSSQNITGELFLTENGLTFLNVLLFEDVLRCNFDLNSSIPLKKGQFPIIANNSIYKEGVFTINETSGAVTLTYGKKTETVTFIILK